MSTEGNDPVPTEVDRGVERDGSAPPQQADANASAGYVDLVGLLSDEFGIARSVARRDVLMGTVTVDGEPYNGDRLDVPRDQVEGKTVEVKGGDSSRTYRVQVA